jgi:steroid delta-isomerase-like uncharacterized protein
MPATDATIGRADLDLRLPAALRRYFEAWNGRDADGVLRSLAPDGSYNDPTAGGPLRGDALHAYVSGLFAAFLDLTFDVSTVTSRDERTIVEWLMRGTHLGSLESGLPPTGNAIALPGVDVFTLRGDAIESVQGYFDQKTFLEQLGLQVMAQPKALGPLRFGRSVWLSLGRTAKPGAFSTTWIDVTSDADRDEVVERSRQIMTEMSAMPGFIGATFTNVGRRLSTLSAWESEDAAHAILKLATHRSALGRFFSGELGVAVHTSVWVPERQNPLWIRCPACGRVEKFDRDGRSACGEPFPEQPPYW